MTPIEIAKRHFPAATDSEARDILISVTAWPFCTAEHAEQQLAHMAVKASTPQQAVSMAHDEMSLAWDAYQAQQRAEAS